MRIILFESSNYLICEFSLLFFRDDERKPKAEEMNSIPKKTKTKVNHPSSTSMSRKKSRLTRDTGHKCYAESPVEDEDEEEEDDDGVDLDVMIGQDDGDDAIGGVDVDKMIGQDNK